MSTTTANEGQTTNQQTQTPNGLGGQLSGLVQKAKDNMGQGGGPLADKAKSFAKQRPAATAALVGVVGLAILNTLRGRS